MDTPKLRILYLHGFASHPKARKSQFLMEHFPLTYTPHIKYPLLLPHAIYVTVTALRKHRPDLIIGSSYGGAITLLLMQLNIWRGPTILLAQAMGIIFPTNRLWIPDNIPACTLIHGTEDWSCPIAGSRKIYANTLACDPAGSRVKLLEVVDVHNLNKTMLENGELLTAITEVMGRAKENQKEMGHNYISDAWIGTILIRCMLALMMSFLLNLHVFFYYLPKRWLKLFLKKNTNRNK